MSVGTREVIQAGRQCHTAADEIAILRCSTAPCRGPSTCTWPWTTCPPHGAPERAPGFDLFPSDDSQSHPGLAMRGGPSIPGSRIFSSGRERLLPGRDANQIGQGDVGTEGTQAGQVRIAGVSGECFEFGGNRLGRHIRGP